MKYKSYAFWCFAWVVYAFVAASAVFEGDFILAGVALFMSACAILFATSLPTIEKPPKGWFGRMFWFKSKDRQPMATAKSGGWEPPRNWNHRPDGMKRPEPPPGPPNRVDRVGVFIPQPTPEGRGVVGFWDLPRTWPDVDDAAGAGLAWARQAAAEEKKELDFRIRALSGFMRSPHRGFDRIDQAEQDLLRHQCELMQGYSAVLGARIANWRDGGGK